VGSEMCIRDRFYGQSSIGGIRSLAYSLIEIGAVVAIVGVAVALVGAKAKPSSPK